MTNNLTDNLNLKRTFSFKKLHIIVLIAGSLFLLSGAFQSNVWFDEAYSVALTRKPIFELIPAAYRDVHPFLYYILLRFFAFISGGNVIAARLFSVMGGITLALIGFTHIRKYFGEKTGFFFSLFTFLFASTFKFSIEIRMYIWTAVFVTLAALYAWILVENGFYAGEPSAVELRPNKSCVGKSCVKNIALFTALSLMSAYSHYYGLISVCVINAVVLVSILINKEKRLGIPRYLICAALQLILYIPGFIVFLNQSSSVAQNGYWIDVKYPDIIFEAIYYPFIGDTVGDTTLTPFHSRLFVWGSVALWAAALVKTVIMFIKDRKKSAPLIGAEIVYVGIIAVALAASVWKDVFYVRYVMIMHGILIFTAAYLFSNIKLKSAAVAVLSCFVVLFAVRLPLMYEDIYGKDNFNLNEYIKDRITDDDVIVYNDVMTGSVLSVRYPNNKQYFINPDMDGYPRAYLAFAPVMTTVRDACEIDELEDGGARVWIFDSRDGEGSAFEDITERYDNVKQLSDREFAGEKYRRIYFIYHLIEMQK